MFRFICVALFALTASSASGQAVREALKFKNFPKSVDIVHPEGWQVTWWAFDRKDGSAELLLQVGKWNEKGLRRNEARERFSPALFQYAADAILGARGCKPSGVRVLKWNTYVFPFAC